MVLISFNGWVSLHLSQVMNLLQSSIDEECLQTYLQVSQIRICLDFSLKFLVALKVIVSVWVFDVGDQRVLLAHLDVVVC